MSDEERIKRQVAQSIKAGWDHAGRDGFVSPELAKAWTEQLGIHPDRVQDYAIAQQAHIVGRGDAPDPENFKQPKIVPFRKPDDGPKNNGGPA